MTLCDFLTPNEFLKYNNIVGKINENMTIVHVSYFIGMKKKK